MKRTSAAEPRVLLTGFDPFGGESSNPSWQAVSQLDQHVIAGHRVHSVQLPTRFGRSLQRLRALMATTQPRLVLCVGQAGGRAQVSLERVAINIDDARIADNAGRQPVDRPVVRGGPAAYFSTLPIKRMRQALLQADIPAEISQTAGTFVCNHVFYGLMHALRETPQVRGGFIHIPFSPAQATQHAGSPSLPLETVVAALRIAIAVALTTRRDLRQTAGATH